MPYLIIQQHIDHIQGSFIPNKSCQNLSISLRVCLFSGTSRLLRFLNSAQLLRDTNNAALQKTRDVIEFALMTHKNLIRAIDFIPENTLVGSHDVIPGLESNTNQG
jgi:hypothetical protein